MHERPTFGNQAAVPERAVLVFQEDELAGGGGTRAAPRFVQQHQSQEAHRLGLGQQLDQEPRQPDRLEREVVPCERRARGCGVPLVEHQVHHVEDGIQAIGQVGP